MCCRLSLLFLLRQPDTYYIGIGSLHDELIAHLPHTGPIYKNDNKTVVYLALSKASVGTSDESTVKMFVRTKGGHAAYLAVINNHAGDAKYHTIILKRTNFVSQTKWNGRSHPFENCVSNHCVAYDDLTECSNQLTGVVVPNDAQRVKFLLNRPSSGKSRINEDTNKEKMETR